MKVFVRWGFVGVAAWLVYKFSLPLCVGVVFAFTLLFMLAQAGHASPARATHDNGGAGQRAR